MTNIPNGETLKQYGSTVWPLFFLLYINNLTENLHSIWKLFPNGTFLSSTVTDTALWNSHLNDDLCKINDWACNCEMSFNLDGKKLAHEVVMWYGDDD